MKELEEREDELMKEKRHQAKEVRDIEPCVGVQNENSIQSVLFALGLHEEGEVPPPSQICFIFNTHPL